MNAKQVIHQNKMIKWTALLRDQSESGLTVKEWCKQNNYTIHTYHYWKHLLKEEAVRSVLPEIVPLVASPDSIMALPETHHALSAPPESRDSRYPTPTPSTVTVSIGDIRIEIGATASDKIISNVIKAVRHA